MLVIVLAFIHRLGQQALGLKAFDSSEFVNIPVVCFTATFITAMVTDPTGLGPERGKGRNVGLKGRLLFTWPPRFLLIIVLLLIVRLLQDVLGFRAFDASEFLNLPVLGVLAVVVIALITAVVVIALITDPSDLGPKDEDAIQ